MDFFISYTGADVAWAEWIAWELEKEGFDCVLQAWDFTPGEDFIHQMQEAASQAKQTIAVLTPEYLLSDFVAVELSAVLARDPIGRQRALIPVRVAACEPTGLLRGRIYIDLVDVVESEARQKLLDGIRAALVGRRKPDDAARFPAAPAFPASLPTSTAPALETLAATSEKRRGAATGPLRLLFLGSAAGIPLDLERELREMTEVIGAARLAEAFRIASRFNVTAEDLFQSLNQESPNILHFSGTLHAGSVLLHSADGGVKAVSESALVGLIRAATSELRLVVLNACRSLGCAETLADVVGCAIGVRDEISDPAAIAFSRAFYRALAYGHSIRNAHEQARLALEMGDVPREQWPELVAAPGVAAVDLPLVPPIVVAAMTPAAGP